MAWSIYFSVRTTIDPREREDQTWCNVVYAALRVRGGQSSLPDLYGVIEGHEKT